MHPTLEEKKFLTFLVNYIVDNKPGVLQTNLVHLSKHMRENLPTNSLSNKYRKRYGNLKDCVTSSTAIMTVFKLDNTTFKMKKWEELVAANEAGFLEPEAWDKIKTGVDQNIENEFETNRLIRQRSSQQLPS